MTAIKNSTVKTRQSIIESEIKIELPGNSIITIMATCRDQKEGYVKMYTSDFDKNDGSINVEKIAGKLGVSIEEDKAFIICQEEGSRKLCVASFGNVYVLFAACCRMGLFRYEFISNIKEPDPQS